MSVFPEPVFSEHPRPNLPVLSPEHPPLPGQQLCGYMIYDAPSATLVKPHPGRLSGMGWLSVIGLALFFWPASCVPCCLGCCYDGFQIPIYK